MSSLTAYTQCTLGDGSVYYAGVVEYCVSCEEESSIVQGCIVVSRWCRIDRDR